MDAVNYKPLANVAVTVDSIDWTFTDREGMFHLKLNDSRKMILFSCIGYGTDRVEIPADRIGFKIQLQREYISIERTEIDSLHHTLQKNSSGNHSDQPPARNDIVMDAEYPGGIKYFQFDLSSVIRRDSVNASRLLKDKLVEVNFEVDALGKMIVESQRIDSVSRQVQKWLDQLKSWEPAIQNRVYVSQYFKMLLTWPERSGNVIEDPVFVVVEEPAMPKGGMIVFYEFVGENLRYPIEAIKKGIVGKVLIEFIVETSGKISHVKVIKGIGGGCDQEAARVVSQSPVWRPGLHRGKAVRQKMIIPISFNQGTRKWRIN